MDSEIKDIIQKLLVKEPSARLGAGEKGKDILKESELLTAYFRFRKWI